ncbi:MAG: hypothetical protein LWY06_20110, partial [Firmicutes bacterium]|nr:hypothetical protein [Bacillota bacterium]
EKKSIDYTQASNYAATRLETIKKNTTTADDFNNIQSVSYMTLDNTNMFIYDIDVDSASTSLKQIGITIYYSNGNTTNPAPDSSKPNNGKILRLGTYLIKP